MKDYKIKINGNEYSISVKEMDDNVATVSVNGVEYSAEVETTVVKPKTPKVVQKSAVISTDSHPATSRTTAPSGISVGVGAGASIKSPLPGVILDVVVREGDTVSVGQKLMILEAMKMENNIESDIAGKVISIVKRKGDSVLEGDILITIG